MSPDMNHIEHLWDDIGRTINDRVPSCQNLQELRDVLVQEWQSIPLRTLRRFVQSIRRRVDKFSGNVEVTRITDHTCIEI